MRWMKRPMNETVDSLEELPLDLTPEEFRQKMIETHDRLTAEIAADSFESLPFKMKFAKLAILDKVRDTLTELLDEEFVSKPGNDHLRYLIDIPDQREREGIYE